MNNNFSPKNGISTSEFWLTLVTVVLTAVLPYLINMPTVYEVASLAVAVLATLGYTASRTVLKNTAANTAADLAIATAIPPTDSTPGVMVRPTVTSIPVVSPLHPDVTPIGSVPGA